MDAMTDTHIAEMKTKHEMATVKISSLKAIDRISITSSSDSSIACGSHVPRKRRNLHKTRSGIKDRVAGNDVERCNRTFASLQAADLLDLCIQTSQLTEENIKLKKEIARLEDETRAFLKTLQHRGKYTAAKEIENQASMKII